MFLKCSSAGFIHAGLTISALTRLISSAAVGSVVEHWASTTVPRAVAFTDGGVIPSLRRPLEMGVETDTVARVKPDCSPSELSLLVETGLKAAESEEPGCSLFALSLMAGGLTTSKAEEVTWTPLIASLLVEVGLTVSEFRVLVMSDMKWSGALSGGMGDGSAPSPSLLVDVDVDLRASEVGALATSTVLWSAASLRMTGGDTDCSMTNPDGGDSLFSPII